MLVSLLGVLMSGIVTVTVANIENSALCISSDGYLNNQVTKDCCAATQGSPIIFREAAEGTCTHINPFSGINYGAFIDCCHERGYLACSNAHPNVKWPHCVKS